MSSAIGPGTEVVCINDDWSPFAYGDKPVSADAPTKNNVYRVLTVEHQYGRVWLTFVECDHDRGYDVDHFRPVRKTDISSLTALLVTPPAFPVTTKPKETV